jgi:hypothetical protein
MRLSWGQTVAGGLPFAVGAGLLLLPGHLLGPDRIGELAVPATHGPVRSVQAAPPLLIHRARVAPRRSQAALASRRIPVTLVAARPRTARVVRPAVQRASLFPVATPRRPLPDTSKPEAAPSPAPTPTPAPPVPAPALGPGPGATPHVTTPAQPARTLAAAPAPVAVAPSNEVAETPQAANEQQSNQGNDGQGNKPQGDQGPNNHGQGNQGGGPGQDQGNQSGGPGQGQGNQSGVPGQGGHGHDPHSGGG